MEVFNQDALDIILPPNGVMVKIEVDVNAPVTIFNDAEGKVYYQFDTNVNRKGIPLPILGAIRVDKEIYFRNFNSQIVVLATDRISNDN